MDLLDTSAFVAVPRNLLETRRSAGARVVVSPFGIWEVLTHLDEGVWERARGRALKALCVEIADDPRAVFEREQGITTPDLASKEHDGMMLGVILHRLEQSDSLAEFYADTVKDSRGRHRLLVDSIQRIRGVLDQEAADYLAVVGRIAGLIQAGGVDLTSEEAYHRATMQLVHAEQVKAERRGARKRGLPEIVRDRFYVYCAHFLDAAQRAVESASSGSRNDYEDGRTILHLRLSHDVRFVTHDVRLAASVANALRRAEGAGLAVRLSVCSAEDYMASVGARGA
jgi:hypothetical protein